MIYGTAIEHFTIRTAEPEDTALILRFIRELAAYEKLEHEVVATEEILHQSLFIRHQAEVLIAQEGDQPVGFALFFHNFSTFLGKANLYLEDLYVDPACRGKGYGKAMLACLAKVAVERGCERLDWWCLDWNEPSIRFYRSLGAKPMSDWTVYRLEGESLKAFGKNETERAAR